MTSPYDLKKEEDVKEYLDNLHTEYSFQCFHEKLPEGCQRLADYYDFVRIDKKEAEKIYRLNCLENRHGESCFKLGNYMALQASSDQTDEKRKFAYKYHDDGCNLGYMSSCHNVSVMSMDDEGKWKHFYDLKKAVTLLDKACTNNHVKSCFRLNALYLQGRDTVDADLKKAFQYAWKGCELGHAPSCANTSRMYKVGDGVEKSKELAKEYKDKALLLANQGKYKLKSPINMSI